jgi:predicted TIM-barrel fold metal-dependent hydrolase
MLAARREMPEDPTMTTRRTRREALLALGAMAAAAGGLTGCATEEPVPVKWSTGTDRPKTKAPANAADCHHHIYDRRFPTAANATLKPGDALVADYRALQRRIGTTRNVIVQPSTYGIDNRLLMESLAAFGKNARGVAVVNTEVTDAELKQLHEAGVRGIRFNLAPPGTTTLDMVRPLAQRIAAMGWHVQVNAPAAALLEAKPTWSDLPCPVVFDHLARVLQPGKLDEATFAMVRDLVQRDRAWVKLSGFYLDSKFRSPTYADSVRVASIYAGEAPERVVWGSDWPHPTEQASKIIPDDALLFDLLAEAVPNEGMRKRVLVDNPARLYQFG